MLSRVLAGGALGGDSGVELGGGGAVGGVVGGVCGGNRGDGGCVGLQRIAPLVTRPLVGRVVLTEEYSEQRRLW